MIFARDPIKLPSQDGKGGINVVHLVLQHLILLGTHARVPPEPDAQVVALERVLESLLHPCSVEHQLGLVQMLVEVLPRQPHLVGETKLLCLRHGDIGALLDAPWNLQDEEEVTYYIIVLSLCQIRLFSFN